MEAILPNLPYPSPVLRLMLLGSVLWLAQASANAQQGFGPEPPELLEYATPTPQRLSRAGAYSSFDGSQRSTVCTSSWSFWECRSGLNNSDWVRQTATDDSRLTAERDEFVFGPRMDTTPATGRAQARTYFGANLAQASATGSRSFIETRVQGAWDGSISSEEGFTRASAYASSLYAETLIPDLDGEVELQFELLQHPSSHDFSGSSWPYELNPGWTNGSLVVQVFNLDHIIEYWPDDSDFPVEGPAIMASGEIFRDGDDGSGSSFMNLAFEVVAGARYAVVSSLRVEAFENASLDFYGTATLQRILVTPGMQLQFGSGTAYTVTPVPEPGAWLLMLAGLVAVSGAVRRRTWRG